MQITITEDDICTLEGLQEFIHEAVKRGASLRDEVTWEYGEVSVTIYK